MLPATAAVFVSEPAAAGAEREPAPAFDLIELLFFAYRDFVGDADRLLETYGFGRAHHRVLHFVSRQPGLTIAELLDILKITKQSLNRVMKELLDAGFIEVRSGSNDRRQRLLFVSPEGSRLALDLARLQSKRFRTALATLAPASHELVTEFLLGMVDLSERSKVTRLVWPQSQASADAVRAAE
jgi:DNA-binding MarR family transcriptional regulator